MCSANPEILAEGIWCTAQLSGLERASGRTQGKCQVSQVKSLLRRENEHEYPVSNYKDFTGQSDIEFLFGPVLAFRCSWHLSNLSTSFQVFRGAEDLLGKASCTQSCSHSWTCNIWQTLGGGAGTDPIYSRENQSCWKEFGQRCQTQWQDLKIMAGGSSGQSVAAGSWSGCICETRGGIQFVCFFMWTESSH